MLDIKHQQHSPSNIFYTAYLFNLPQLKFVNDRLKKSIATSKRPNLTPTGGKVSPSGSQKTSKRAPKTQKSLLRTPKRPKKDWTKALIGPTWLPRGLQRDTKRHQNRTKVMHWGSSRSAQVKLQYYHEEITSFL